jgi:DnaJ-class molecular chaperone
VVDADANSTTPYARLGVGKDASLAAIRRAYRRLAKRHHPGNSEAEARFKVISAANELLSGPDKLARFDNGEIEAAGQERAQPPPYQHYANGQEGQRDGRAALQPEAWGAGEFGGDRHPPGPRRGADQRYTPVVTFLDALNGATRGLTLPNGRTLDVKIPPATANGRLRAGSAFIRSKARTWCRSIPSLIAGNRDAPASASPRRRSHS